jgi:hypothetical protein
MATLPPIAAIRHPSEISSLWKSSAQLAGAMSGLAEKHSAQALVIGAAPHNR